MFYSSQIELSKSAFRQNLRFLKKRFGPKVLFCSVIKGNAYGHGINVFVPMAEDSGVRHFAVFDADEALRAVKCRSQNSTVIVMGSIDDEQALEWAVENDVQFYVFDTERLHAGLQAARRVGRPARIHLEVETGLNRMGLEAEELDETIRVVKSNSKHLVIEGVSTHYAGAESIANYVRIQDQISRYREVCDRLVGEGVRIGLRHTACSAAALRYPETIMDMVRIGIAQYGFWPNKETEMDYYLRNQLAQSRPVPRTLRRVLRWSSRVMNIKTIPRGEFIGYGTSYLTTRRERIASVPVGYFHGFSRSLSNLGRVLVHGRRAPVVGLVNMNMMMVDVTHIPRVQKGDEVVIIGKQKKGHIDVASFSDLTRYLNYEVLVRLPSEIPRVIVQ